MTQAVPQHKSPQSNVSLETWGIKLFQKFQAAPAGAQLWTQPAYQYYQHITTEERELTQSYVEKNRSPSATVMGRCHLSVLGCIALTSYLKSNQQNLSVQQNERILKSIRTTQDELGVQALLAAADPGKLSKWVKAIENIEVLCQEKLFKSIEEGAAQLRHKASANDLSFIFRNLFFYIRYLCQPEDMLALTEAHKTFLDRVLQRHRFDLEAIKKLDPTLSADLLYVHLLALKTKFELRRFIQQRPMHTDLKLMQKSFESYGNAAAAGENKIAELLKKSPKHRARGILEQGIKVYQEAKTQMESFIEAFPVDFKKRNAYLDQQSDQFGLEKTQPQVVISEIASLQAEEKKKYTHAAIFALIGLAGVWVTLNFAHIQDRLLLSEAKSLGGGFQVYQYDVKEKIWIGRIKDAHWAKLKPEETELRSRKLLDLALANGFQGIRLINEHNYVLLDTRQRGEQKEIWIR